MRLTSIQVTSHLHAGPENYISCPSRSNLKPIQVSLCVSYFHSCPASPASMSPHPPPPTPTPPLHAPFHIHPCPQILQFMLQPNHLHPNHVSLASWSSLSLILVTIIASQLHQGPSIPPSRYRGICVSLPSTPLSTPSRPLDSRLTFIQIESHPNPGPHNCISPPSRWHLTPSQAPTIASQIHKDTISDPHRFQNVHLTSILALAHLNPEPKNIASPPSIYPLTSIQVHRFPSYTYPGNVSNPSTPPRLTSHIPPVRVSPQSSSRYLHLTSTQMMSHLHPCPRILVSPPSRYCITSIQVQKLFSHNDPYRGSHLSRFHLTQIQVEMWVSSPSTPHLISI